MTETERDLDVAERQPPPAPADATDRARSDADETLLVVVAAPASGTAAQGGADGTDDQALQESRLRLDDQLCFALYRATNAITRTYRPLLRAIGLTYPQYVVMMAFWEHGELTPTRLAAIVDLPVHGLGPVLSRLQQQGFVERRPAPRDRRSTRLVLTDAGRALEAEAARAQRTVACQTHMELDDLTELRDDLNHLSQNLTSTS